MDTMQRSALNEGCGVIRGSKRGPPLPPQYRSALPSPPYATQRGCPTAASNLVKMILDGRGGIFVGAGGGTASGAATPAALATALFRRAAASGSASAWYNLAMCHLQQFKQQGGKGAAGGRGSADPRA
ncbi:hypothetical protein GPECTOR_42g764 [Gonium pectorale]|uniref:Uncharacterized protein n=1 Tax=Gonium pectorale TaxID=33097 RepID=A0A150G9M9_GONPE|nr:hypothetical protein GPECTOR_42g764 [Gonium pectorale]|eukprot:KXZ46556.1 hypothetical protein GPECTOR_42g764 [Gonium pectorale]